MFHPMICKASCILVLFRMGNCAAAKNLLLGVLILAIGCDEASTKNSLPMMEQIFGRKEPEPIAVGVLFSQTGEMSISEMQLKHAVLQAIDEINADGGILGRRVVPLIRDGRSRSDIVAKRARELVDLNVPVIFGGWRSIDRKAMLPIVETSQTLLFYPLQYEGNESSRSVFYGGMTPNQQILPALDWFMSPEGGSRKRVFLIGSDYVFPRTANYIVQRYLAGKDMQVVGEAYVSLDHENFDQEFEAIQAARPDLILSTINGDSNIPFFRLFQNLGLHPDTMPIFATSLGESGLQSMPALDTAGHYAAWTFFQSLPQERARTFVRRFHDEYGADRAVHDPMESAYTQVHLWRNAVEKSRSLEADDIRKVLENAIEYEGPGGLVRIDPRNHHVYKRLRIGRINANQQFDIVHESPDWIRPEPYPGFAFPGWDCDWTQGGMRKGPAVRIEK